MTEIFAMIVNLIENHWEIIDAVLVVTGLVIYVTASHTFHQRRHPSAAIAWVLGIIVLPFIVLPLYLAFGRRKVVASRLSASPRQPSLTASTAHPTAARTLQLGVAMALPDPANYEDLDIHQDGSHSLTALREVISSAKNRLDVSTFVLGRDVLGDEIIERLKRQARAGVKVRLLVDGIGIYLGGHPNLAAIAEAGIEVARFVPPFWSSKRGRTNLRNHRKMVIADGARLWTGGRNLAAEYFEGDRRPILGRKPWLDLSFDLGGPLVQQAQAQFDVDWNFATDKHAQETTLPATASPLKTDSSKPYAQLIASGPDHPDDTFFTLLISACFTSQRRILAVTPYFVPDASLLTSLTLAARRGIEIDLVIPAQSNHRLADLARHRSLRDLVGAGGHVWVHPRMIHAKGLVIDDELAFAGSANLDGRSLFLNYEMMIAFFDRKAVHEFSRWMSSRKKECAPYVARKPTVLRELSEGLILWLAFQL